MGYHSACLIFMVYWFDLRDSSGVDKGKEGAYLWYACGAEEYPLYVYLCN